MLRGSAALALIALVIPFEASATLARGGNAMRKLRATLVLTCLLVIAADPAGAEFRLLDPVKETNIGRIEKFVAAEAFRIGSRIGGRTLSAIGLNFTQHFMGVVETDVPAISLSGWTLLYTTGDKSLVRALGGEQEAAVPFLAYVHRLMEMGEEGAGHTDWRSNFAYLRSSIDGRLWAVHWSVNYANEWTIGAVYVPHSDLDWRSGSRLFSSAETWAHARHTGLSPDETFSRHFLLSSARTRRAQAGLFAAFLAVAVGLPVQTLVSTRRQLHFTERSTASGQGRAP